MYLLNCQKPNPVKPLKSHLMHKLRNLYFQPSQTPNFFLPSLPTNCLYPLYPNKESLPSFIAQVFNLFSLRWIFFWNFLKILQRNDLLSIFSLRIMSQSNDDMRENWVFRVELKLFKFLFRENSLLIYSLVMFCHFEALSLTKFCLIFKFVFCFDLMFCAYEFYFFYLFFVLYSLPKKSSNKIVRVMNMLPWKKGGQSNPKIATMWVNIVVINF